MAIEAITRFIKDAPTDLASAWDFDAVGAMAGQHLPDALLGDQYSLLKGDQYRLWMRWFLEGMVSPNRLAIDPNIGKLEVLQNAVKRVNALYTSYDAVRREELAKAVSNHIFDMVTSIRQKARRDHASTATRHALIAAHPIPRCYICGYAFSQEARDSYLRVKGRNSIKLPTLVDVFRPKGLVERDEKIEVEHVVPVAAGGSGQANLRLACGWCNKHKSDRVSIYEASFLSPKTLPFRVAGNQLVELPNPFWVVRILALRKRCLHQDGCNHSALDAELFVSLVDWSGSPNPTNLTVYCEHHDPLRIDRLQSRSLVEKLWREKRV